MYPCTVAEPDYMHAADLVTMRLYGGNRGYKLH